MKTINLILIFILFWASMLGQSENREARAQLDSMRQAVLNPKLKLYNQRLEKLTAMINQSSEKRCIKQYARQIVQVSDAFQDNIASLYDCGLDPWQGGGWHMGFGMGPWFYPGFGWYAYPYGYYPYSGYYTYDCMPQLFHEVDRIKKYANSMRVLSSRANVSRKMGYLQQEMELLKRIEENPDVVPGVTVR